MTDTATRRRPSPYPRPVPTSTESDTAACNAESKDASPERETAEKSTPTLQSAITDRDAWLRWIAAAREYFTPPSLLTEPPPSYTELRAYAHRAGWTSKDTGVVRTLGVWWHRFVGLPVTFVCRYAEWIAQRPGRAIPVFALWKLLILTTPGPWLADHIIRPVLGFVAWVLL
jgi:hypothetical protein